MTVPGIDATVALSIVAAVGDFTRFRTPEKLVAYLGLNPRVRQSGGQPASHGRITKAGSAHIVRQRTRLKNQVHAILHRNLIPRCPRTCLAQGPALAGRAGPPPG